MKRTPWMLLGLLVLVLSWSLVGCGGDGDSDDAEKASSSTGDVKVGEGGKDNGIAPGPLGTPLRALSSVRDRALLMQIQSQMNYFRGVEGRLPETQKEFMKEIIEKGSVDLPELPADREYYYDKEKGELFVRQKK